MLCSRSLIRYTALYCHNLSFNYYWSRWTMRWWYRMFRFWPSLWSSSWKLRADSLCLSNGGQSWTKEPWSCLSLVLGFRSEEEELSGFILNTTAYDAGLPATDLAKSGTKEQTQRVRERKTVWLTFIFSQFNSITAIKSWKWEITAPKITHGSDLAARHKTQGVYNLFDDTFLPRASVQEIH